MVELSKGRVGSICFGCQSTVVELKLKFLRPVRGGSSSRRVSDCHCANTPQTLEHETKNEYLFPEHDEQLRPDITKYHHVPNELTFCHKVNDVITFTRTCRSNLTRRMSDRPTTTMWSLLGDRLKAVNSFRKLMQPRVLPLVSMLLLLLLLLAVLVNVVALIPS